MLPTRAPEASEIQWLNSFNQLGLTSHEWKSWLEEEGSLTLRLKSQANEGFKVRILSEEQAQPTQAEAKLLNLGKQNCWVRQVYLEVDNQPWVFARSVMPLANSNAASSQLTKIGSQPLGHLLFSNPQVKRTPLVFCKPKQLAMPSLWGRASCFVSQDINILVTEHFLHPMAQRLDLPLI